MSPINLSPRLRAIAELVPFGCHYADIGTDHAYLPVWLLQNQKISFAIASDLREGPLNHARQTAARYELTNQISFRLCDGLSGLSPDEVDTVSIAGMGGETIADILSAAPWACTKNRRWLLQPMSGAEELRTWLCGHGFFIEREYLVQESRTIYVILSAQPGGSPTLTPGELWAGRQWKGMDSPLRTCYLEKLLERAARAREGAHFSGKREDASRRDEFDKIHQSLSKLKKEWDSWQR